MSWESADQLLARYETLGVPHFQRGLIWGSDSVAQLLESLFWKTPCGSVILWEPRKTADHGIPLIINGRLRHFIIDGQQRIRSLWSVFRPEPDQPDLDAASKGGVPVDDADALVPRVWCVDLTHVPSLAPHFGPPSRFSMFRMAADPRHARARIRRGLLPLTWIRSADASDIESHIRTHDRPEAAEALLRSGLRERLCAMTADPLFAVRILEEAEHENRLVDVVAVYNRINSAGKRVEAEERAYAALVAYAPVTPTWLRDLFDSIHGQAEGRSGASERDDVLQRRKESGFGFKLFLRTFVQVAAYHMQHSIGRTGFSFDLIRSEGFHRRLSDPAHAGLVEGMLERTKQILVFVRLVLREKLHCDDLRMLPEASSLWPVIQLLTRYPALMEEPHCEHAKQVVAGLMLRLYLATREAPELMRLVGVVNRSHTARSCVAEMAASLEIEEVMRRLSGGLGRSRSIQDRHVLMLYWLVRSSEGARDFSYENLELLGRMRPKHQELAICEGCEPEKQHLVPYVRLAAIYRLTGRDRVSSHPINDIGNLTYISRWLNGFKEGLGGDPVDLRIEPADNKHAHLLAAEDGTDLSDAYGAALAASKKDAYEDFCRARRDLIASGFRRWLESTEDWASALDDAPRIDPADRYFAVTDGQRVRAMSYPPAITDALLDWLATGQLRRKTSGKALGVREVFQLPKESDKRAARMRLHLLPKRVLIEPVVAQEIERLEAALSALAVPTSPGADPAGWAIDASAGADGVSGAHDLRIASTRP